MYTIYSKLEMIYVLKKYLLNYRKKLKDAVNDLLKNRDGLVLGICNGFQALVKEFYRLL